MAIVQRQPATDPPQITVTMVRRILELGEMLASVLTRDEIKEVQQAYDFWKSTSSSRASDTGNIIGT